MKTWNSTLNLFPPSQTHSCCHLIYLINPTTNFTSQIFKLPVLPHGHYHSPNQANIISHCCNSCQYWLLCFQLCALFNSFCTQFSESITSLFFLEYVNRFPVWSRLMSNLEISYRALYDLRFPSFSYFISWHTPLPLCALWQNFLECSSSHHIPLPFHWANCYSSFSPQPNYHYFRGNS